MLSEKEICMSATGITKVYPGTIALDNVDFNIYKGKVNILIGENGAGKSTLMKIIAGIEQMTKGSLTLEGKEIKISSIADAEENGIGIIHQELNLFPNMTVYQNIFMARETTKNKVFLDNEIHIRETEEVLKRLEHYINVNSLVGSLQVGQKQIVEIARAVCRKNLKILIMDEPTSSLGTSEIEILFKVVNELKASRISIVYISHRLGEIKEIGDHVTVLRDGKKVAEEEVKNVDINWMVSNMLNKDQEDKSRARRKYSDDEVLRVDNVSMKNDAGVKVLDNVSLSLKKGEILGIYGLLGAGRTELLETLMGMHPEATGNFYYNGKEFTPQNISTQIKNGFVMVPEDRQKVGLVQTLNIEKNITLSSLEKYIRRGLLSKIVEDEHADKMIEDLRIRVADKRLPILSLSGGNQQKVVISKFLLTDPEIILLDEPSRGIDVGAKEEVFNIVRQLADQGRSIILVASELKEILSISDRIVVLCNGRVTAQFDDDVEEWNLADAATDFKQ